MKCVEFYNWLKENKILYYMDNYNNRFRSFAPDAYVYGGCYFYSQKKGRGRHRRH